MKRRYLFSKKRQCGLSWRQTLKHGGRYSHAQEHIRQLQVNRIGHTAAFSPACGSGSTPAEARPAADGCASPGEATCWAPVTSCCGSTELVGPAAAGYVFAWILGAVDALWPDPASGSWATCRRLRRLPWRSPPGGHRPERSGSAAARFATACCLVRDLCNSSTSKRAPYSQLWREGGACRK
ncbi:hypothetical protein HMPREF1207_05600 [Paenibacillus sp. HGH0039]|nr:hypothetical protein HMPREF1207_05600 [Paenibacillus sp. HGH0039]